MNSIPGVYCITVNGEYYVGSSMDIVRRWKQHRTDLKRNVHRNSNLQLAYNTHGAESLVYKVLELVEDEATLSLREQHWMDTLHPSLNGVTYANSVHELISRRTKEALADPAIRAKISAAGKGKPKSDAAKKSLGIAAKKRWESEEYRQKFTEARKEKRDEPYKRSEEARKNISEGKKGQARPDLANRNADPEYQAKVKAGIDAYWARKRAEKAAKQQEQ